MVTPRILWRYILRDCLLHSLLGLAAFTLVMVVMNVLRFLDDLLAAGVGSAGLLDLVGIILPSYLPYAIPTSLLFGVLLAFGRMSADGEIVAMRASGVSVPGLLPPILLLGLVLGSITTYLQFEVEPLSNHRMKALVRDLARSVQIIQPGEFRPIQKRVVYIDSKGDEACPLRGVVIGDFSDERRPMFISAACGAISENQSEGGLALQLDQGSIHFEDSAEDRYRLIRFEKMSTELDISLWLDKTRKPREFTFTELLELERAFERGETPEVRGRDPQTGVKIQIHRRIAFSLASMLLAALAVPLGIQPLRSGRSAGALTAIGLMALYWVLFSVGEQVAEAHWVEPWVAMWAPNVVAIGAGMFLLRRTIYGDS